MTPRNSKIALAALFACTAMAFAPLASADSGAQEFRTPWGTRCWVLPDQVMCQSCVPGSHFCPNSGSVGVVNASGVYSWFDGDIAETSGVQQVADGQTYHANGWTIAASGGWVRFTNDATGHGVSFAPQNRETF
jgi:hypothetical protein